MLRAWQRALALQRPGIRAADTVAAAASTLRSSGYVQPLHTLQQRAITTSQRHVRIASALPHPHIQRCQPVAAAYSSSSSSSLHTRAFMYTPAAAPASAPFSSSSSPLPAKRRGRPVGTTHALLAARRAQFAEAGGRARPYEGLLPVHTTVVAPSAVDVLPEVSRLLVEARSLEHNAGPLDAPSDVDPSGGDSAQLPLGRWQHAARSKLSHRISVHFTEFDRWRSRQRAAFKGFWAAAPTQVPRDSSPSHAAHASLAATCRAELLQLSLLHLVSKLDRGLAASERYRHAMDELGGRDRLRRGQVKHEGHMARKDKLVIQGVAGGGGGGGGGRGARKSNKSAAADSTHPAPLTPEQEAEVAWALAFHQVSPSKMSSSSSAATPAIDDATLSSHGDEGGLRLFTALCPLPHAWMYFTVDDWLSLVREEVRWGQGAYDRMRKEVLHATAHVELNMPDSETSSARASDATVLFESAAAEADADAAADAEVLVDPFASDPSSFDMRRALEYQMKFDRYRLGMARWNRASARAAKKRTGKGTGKGKGRASRRARGKEEDASEEDDDPTRPRSPKARGRSIITVMPLFGAPASSHWSLALGRGVIGAPLLFLSGEPLLQQRLRGKLGVLIQERDELRRAIRVEQERGLVFVVNPPAAMAEEGETPSAPATPRSRALACFGPHPYRLDLLFSLLHRAESKLGAGSALETLLLHGEHLKFQDALPELLERERQGRERARDARARSVAQRLARLAKRQEGRSGALQERLDRKLRRQREKIIERDGVQLQGPKRFQEEQEEEEEVEDEQEEHDTQQQQLDAGTAADAPLSSTVDATVLSSSSTVAADAAPTPASSSAAAAAIPATSFSHFLTLARSSLPSDEEVPLGFGYAPRALTDESPAVFDLFSQQRDQPLSGFGLAVAAETEAELDGQGEDADAAAAATDPSDSSSMVFRPSEHVRAASLRFTSHSGVLRKCLMLFDTQAGLAQVIEEGIREFVRQKHHAGQWEGMEREYAAMQRKGEEGSTVGGTDASPFDAPGVVDDPHSREHVLRLYFPLLSLRSSMPHHVLAPFYAYHPLSVARNYSFLLAHPPRAAGPGDEGQLAKSRRKVTPRQKEALTQALEAQQRQHEVDIDEEDEHEDEQDEDEDERDDGELEARDEHDDDGKLLLDSNEPADPLVQQLLARGHIISTLIRRVLSATSSSALAPAVDALALAPPAPPSPSPSVLLPPFADRVRMFELERDLLFEHHLRQLNPGVKALFEKVMEEMEEVESNSTDSATPTPTTPPFVHLLSRPRVFAGPSTDLPLPRILVTTFFPPRIVRALDRGAFPADLHLSHWLVRDLWRLILGSAFLRMFPQAFGPYRRGSEGTTLGPEALSILRGHVLGPGDQTKARVLRLMQRQVRQGELIKLGAQLPRLPSHHGGHDGEEAQRVWDAWHPTSRAPGQQQQPLQSTSQPSLLTASSAPSASTPKRSKKKKKDPVTGSQAIAAATDDAAAVAASSSTTAVPLSPLEAVLRAHAAHETRLLKAHEIRLQRLQEGLPLRPGFVAPSGPEEVAHAVEEERQAYQHRAQRHARAWARKIEAVREQERLEAARRTHAATPMVRAVLDRFVTELCVPPRGTGARGRSLGALYQLVQACLAVKELVQEVAEGMRQGGSSSADARIPTEAQLDHRLRELIRPRPNLQVHWVFNGGALPSDHDDTDPASSSDEVPRAIVVITDIGVDELALMRDAVWRMATSHTAAAPVDAFEVRASHPFLTQAELLALRAHSSADSDDAVSYPGVYDDAESQHDSHSSHLPHHAPAPSAQDDRWMVARLGGMSLHAFTGAELYPAREVLARQHAHRTQAAPLILAGRAAHDDLVELAEREGRTQPVISRCEIIVKGANEHE